MSLISDVIRNPAGALERTMPPARGFELDDEDSARFLRIVSHSLSISRHYQLFLWLSGELQQFLPHKIMVSAWGDFASGKFSVDLVSALPGVRTAALAQCSIDTVVRDAYKQWLEGGRRPVVMATTETPRLQTCCQIHQAIRTMRSLLVHGVTDQRTGRDSLYIALHSGPLSIERGAERFTALIESLVTQIDVACRRVAALPLDPSRRVPGSLDLSGRESQILDLVCHGQRNDDIAQALNISPYTVKNHVQRIFRKIGVRNRTQAAAKMHHLRQPEARAAE